MATIIKSLCSLFCIFSCLSLLFYTNQTISQPEHMRTFCNQFSDNFTQTSSYESNRETLLSLLQESSSLGTYSNVTTGLSPNIVRGMFLCRGDVTRTSCSNCVQTATLELAQNCTYQKEALIYYEECMVRYSDTPFLTLVEERPYIIRYSLDSAPNSGFGQTLSDKMDELIVQASSSSSYFVEDQERVEGSYDLDSIVQCSPDLDLRNCTVCLKHAVQEILDCCNTSRLAQIFLPKCLLRYEGTALSSSSPPPLSTRPLPPSLVPSPPPLFTQPQNVPSRSGSLSINVLKGNQIFVRICITFVTVYVLGFVNIDS